MPIILYTIRGASPPAKTVEAVIKIINLDVEKRELNLLEREHLEPWFLKLNPLHQVPVLDDNGYILTDSHAIVAYLLTVYAPKDILEQYYPTDPKQRGLIDSRWHFENGTLFARIKTILLPILIKGVKEAPVEKLEWLIEGVDFLDKLLEGKEWLAGDRLTVADISAIRTIDLVETLIPLKYYKNVSAWAVRVRNTSPFYEEFWAEQKKNFAALMKKQFPHDAESLWDLVKGNVN